MQKTANFNLNQWAASDPIRRADFNADNAAIDGALAAQQADIDTRATKSDLTATNAALNVTNARVDTKAEQSALDRTNAALAAVDTSLAAKADQSDLAALTAAVGSNGKNCRIVTGSYEGNDTYGSGSPTRLTFTFKPMLVYLCDTGSYYECLFLRPMTRVGGSLNGTITSAWTNNGVSWYSSSSSFYQFNTPNTTYYYIAFGYDEG